MNMGITIEPIERLASALIAGENGRYANLQRAEHGLTTAGSPGTDKFLEAIDESVRRQSNGVYSVKEADKDRFPIEVFGPGRYLQIFEIEEPQNERLFILTGSESFFCKEVVRASQEES